MAIDRSPNVSILTGHDNVFNIHFIGELNTQKIRPNIKNIHIKPTIQLADEDSAIFICIPN